MNRVAPAPDVIRDLVAGGGVILDRISARSRRSQSSGPRRRQKRAARLAHGLLAPTSGAVRWQSLERRGERRRQAMVFQRPVVLRRSALDNVVYPLKVAGLARTERGAPRGRSEAGD
jgi:tungstate transport system ATP-binding protein